jgi:hypothetical protein
MRHDPIDGWIEKIAAKKSLVDIGGIGGDSRNERISTAIRAGAKLVAIADFEPFDMHLWKTFREKMSAANIHNFAAYEKIDVRDEAIASKLPRFDIVHSTGILYHLPDPVTAISNLKKITNEYLIVNTVVIPNKITNDRGTFVTDDSRAVFLPSLTENDRLILGEHYRSKFGWEINIHSPRLGDTKATMPYVTARGLSCYPFWWFFTKAAFRHLVQMMGFLIEDEWIWQDHALAVLSKRIWSSNHTAARSRLTGSSSALAVGEPHARCGALAFGASADRGRSYRR